MDMKIGIALGAFSGIVAALLAFDWLVWKLWLWVVPQVWANGPDGFVRPGFWLFAAAWFLVSLAGRSLFGQRSAA
jgi:hypothetical protein